MGMQGQQSQQGQVFYDANTNQYYTMSSPAKMNPMLGIIGGFRSNPTRTYLNDFNKTSVAARPVPAHNYIDIAALFPELSKASTGIPSPLNSLLGIPSEGEDNKEATGAVKGAAQSASSGAGRFM